MGEVVGATREEEVVGQRDVHYYDPGSATGTHGLCSLARVFPRAWIIHQSRARAVEPIGRRRWEASRVGNMDPAHTRVN